MIVKELVENVMGNQQMDIRFFPNEPYFKGTSNDLEKSRNSYEKLLNTEVSIISAYDNVLFVTADDY